VVARPLDESEKADLRTRLATLQPPARRLELVVYSHGEAERPEPRFELNFGDEDESPHWFLLDRAIAERHAVPLVGPAWTDLFAPVSHERLLEALVQSLAWYEEHDPAGAPLAAARAWALVETGEWMSKTQAAAWLCARVRERIEEGGR
jgi:hypothetical protein